MNFIIPIRLRRRLLIEKVGNEEVYYSKNGGNCLIEIVDEDVKFIVDLKKRPAIEVEEVLINSIRFPNINVPGRYTTVPIKFIIKEFFENDKLEFVRNWSRETIEGARGMQNLYAKKILKLECFGKNGNVYESWVLYGAFLTTMNVLETNEVELEINYDHMETLPL